MTTQLIATVTSAVTTITPSNGLVGAISRPIVFDNTSTSGKMPSQVTRAVFQRGGGVSSRQLGSSEPSQRRDLQALLVRVAQNLRSTRVVSNGGRHFAFPPGESTENESGECRIALIPAALRHGKRFVLIGTGRRQMSHFEFRERQ